MVESVPLPSPGSIVRVRTRHWLVQAVDQQLDGTTVSLACADDDAQGDELDVVWEAELDREVLDGEAWQKIGHRGFDPPRHFAAYLNTVRWNCVTATDPRLFQSPFRAGIRIDPYQLEPLHKALRLPRVNLFIADDVGLGKTIEAGLIASELLLRKRVQDIVVACPPSMLLQWKDELENRFGLTFEIYDRQYVERVRRQRGYSVNPWTTFPRFLISHKLLIDEAYIGPMRDWLDNLRPGSLLIFDEAHHAAPSSGSRYAIDSQITKAIRNLASRFEHRLFLSATPHNGHSNSFSTLLAILDHERFVPGIKVLKSSLDAVMVRRLKEDLRSIGIPGFPERRVEQIELPKALGLPALPNDTPELVLARLLDAYRNRRASRLEGQPRRICNQFELLVTQLQQRLLSSVEAFARTLKVHKTTMERVWEKELAADRDLKPDFSKLAAPSADDDRSSLSEETLGEIFDREVEKATLSVTIDADAAPVDAERDLLDQMATIAARARNQPDTRIQFLIRWMREKMCSGAALARDGGPQPGAAWTDLRVIIFTEWDDTKRYLVEQLRSAIVGTDRWEERIEVFHGPTPPEKKDALKRAFNALPSEHPVRILICTDAAREGLNLQAHCHHLFHFDVPWNPARMEQRNGRIDRKLQPSPVVYCHYFIYTQRPEDRVLRVLARKTGTIRDELGSFSKVIADSLTKKLRYGIQRSSVDALTQEIETLEDRSSDALTNEELESVRQRHEELKTEIAFLDRRLREARQAIAYDPAMLRDALSCSLELIGAEKIRDLGEGRYELPDLATRRGADPTWTATLDTLRAPPENGKRDFEWRRTSAVRPIVFEAPPGIDERVVQMHLSHRLVQRLLGRFTSQGFVYDDLSRACLAQTQDSIPRVALLARLAVFGPRATRLHEEILTVTARWSPPGERGKGLTPFAREAEQKTLDLLQRSLVPASPKELPATVREQLRASMAQDVSELLLHLETRGKEALDDAEAKLTARGEAEAAELTKTLGDQRKRVLAELRKSEAGEDEFLQLSLGIDDAETRHEQELEKRQRENDVRGWRKWLDNVEGDLKTEPERIRSFYAVQSHRIEPVGLVYLWPVS